MRIKAVNFYLYNHEFRDPIVTPKVKLTYRKALIVEILSEDDQSFLESAMHLKQIGTTKKQLKLYKKYFHNGQKVLLKSLFINMKIGNHI